MLNSCSRSIKKELDIKIERVKKLIQICMAKKKMYFAANIQYLTKTWSKDQKYTQCYRI